jgi:hypothetical protein
LVDEGGEDLLSGHPGDSQVVGGFSLPDVEGSVGAGREVDGSPGSLGTGWLVVCSMVDCLLGDHPLHGFLSEAREALGWRCVWVDVHCADRPPWVPISKSVHQYTSRYGIVH